MITGHLFIYLYWPYKDYNIESKGQKEKVEPPNLLSIDDHNETLHNKI